MKVVVVVVVVFFQKVEVGSLPRGQSTFFFGGNVPLELKNGLKCGSLELKCCRKRGS